MLHRLLTITVAAVLYSNAAAFDTVIDIPPATSLAGLQSNTQVNVLDGADLSSLLVPSGLMGVELNVSGGSISGTADIQSGANYVTDGSIATLYVRSSSVQVSGGIISNLWIGASGSGVMYNGESNNALATPGGILDINDGTIHDVVSAGTTGSVNPEIPVGVTTIRGGLLRDVSVFRRGEVRIEGGRTTGEINVTDGVLNMSGGRVENLTGIFGGFRRNNLKHQGTFNLSGGELFGGFGVEGADSINPGSKLNISGGVFGRLNRVDSGGSLKLHGAEFLLNGAPVSGPINPTGDYVLTGTLSDGSVVILSSATSDLFAAGTLEIVPTAVPVAAPVINAPSDLAPRGLRAGQTLNLGDGAAIGYHFAAVDATLNMTGGSIDYGAELIGSQANLQGGTVSDALVAYAGSTVNIDGSTVGDFARVRSGASLNLTNGRLGGSSTFEAGSDFVMSGGATGLLTTVHGDAVISGGVVGRRLSMQPGSSLELRGGEFRLNGNPVSGSTTFISGDVLTGVLSDGTPVLFGVGDSLRTFTITETAIPDALLTPIVSPAAPTPRGLRNGQSFTLQAGAVTVDDFTSLGAEIVVNGGQIASRFEANDTRINSRSGSIGSDATLFGNSELIVRGGCIGDNLTVRGGATLTQIGGAIGTVALTAGATLNVAGGVFGGQPDDLAGQDFWAPAGSAINLFGVSFTQNGVDLLANIGLGESVVVTNKSAALDGVLADGSEFGLVAGGRARTIGNGAFTLTKLLLGDFNHDGVVNAADYTVWRDSEGQEIAAGAGADHDFDGMVTASDHEVWAANYGRSFSALASLGVPEPVSAGLTALACVLGWAPQSRRRCHA